MFTDLQSTMLERILLRPVSGRKMTAAAVSSQSFDPEHNHGSS